MSLTRHTRVATGLAIAVALTACSTSNTTQPSASSTAPKSGQTIVYIAPSSWASGDALKANIAAYEKKSGNKVTLQAVPDEQYDGIVQARLTAGNGIDVFGGQDKVKDPASIMLPMDGPWINRLLPSIKETITKPDGKIYGVPAFDPAHSVGFLYNKDVFAKAGVNAAPTTLAEVNDAFAKVKTAGATPFFVSGADGWTLLQHRTGVIANAQAADPTLVGNLDTNKATWSTIPGFTEEYAALADWVKAGYVNKDVLTAKYEAGTAAVASGKAGAIFNGTWSIGDLVKANPNGNFGFFPLPAVSGKTVIALYDPSLLKVAKANKVADAAKDFLNFLAEPEQLTASLDSQPGVPVYTDVKLSKPVAAFDDVTKFVTAGDVVRGFDNASALPSPGDDFIAAYQKLIGGKLDAAGFAAENDKIWVSSAQKGNIPGF